MDIVDTPFYNSEYFANTFQSTAAATFNAKLPANYKNPPLVLRAKIKAISQQLEIYNVASTNIFAGLNIYSDWTLLKWIECAACQHFHKFPLAYFFATDEYKKYKLFYNVRAFQEYFDSGARKSKYEADRFYAPLLNLLDKVVLGLGEADCVFAPKSFCRQDQSKFVYSYYPIVSANQRYTDIMGSSKSKSASAVFPDYSTYQN